jgi:hypothetical protein
MININVGDNTMGPYLIKIISNENHPPIVSEEGWLF